MITPQTSKEVPTVAGSQLFALPFTKAQLARLYFGTRRWTVDVDVAVTTPLGTGSWERSMVVDAGIEWTTSTGGATGNQTIPRRAAWTEARESVQLHSTFRRNYIGNSIGINLGEAFEFFPTLYQVGAVLYPYLSVRSTADAGGYIQEVGSWANGLSATTQDISIIYDGRKVPAYTNRGNTAGFNFTGAIVITPEAW